MIASARYINTAKWALPLVVFIFFLLHFTASPATYSQLMRTFKNEKKLFIADVLANEIDGAFDGNPITRMCSSKQWHDDWILQCDNVPFGLAEQRSHFLQCIRLAIEIGASGLILPDIVQRSEHDIAVMIPMSRGPLRGVSLTYLFDFDHLYHSLSTSCPQMKLYSSINELHDVPSVLTGIPIKIFDLGLGIVNGTLIAHPELVADKVIEQVRAKDTRKERPLKIKLTTGDPEKFAFFWWPTHYDPPDFRSNFGKLLRIRSDCRALAASALYQMRRRFGFDLVPRRHFSLGKQAERSQDAFLGVRMRTARDVAHIENWPTYEDQAPYLLTLAVDRQYPVIFLAQGAAERDVEKFKRRLGDFNATVVQKTDLLEPDELDILKGLTWDQQALVDYEIMLRSGHITGIAQSTFTLNLAVKRANAYQSSSTVSSANDTVETSHGIIEYQDKYSTIYGPKLDRIGKLSVPGILLSIWP